MITYLKQKWDELTSQSRARQDLAVLLGEEIFSEPLTELEQARRVALLAFKAHLDMDDTHNFVDPEDCPK